jgi:ATP-dependent DNA helicase RecG
LSAKGNNPDVLVMTATPIPRTLCLTLYGDLDVSTINEIPPGRGKISTHFFKNENAGQAYRIVLDAVKRGEQAYIVYPIIDESEKLELKSAQEMFKQLQASIFKECKLGLLHGQMKKQQAQTVMKKFIEKEIDILVATTILEVGVDVPNVTMMVIEHADRFGLSQLHQLRGRIGRGLKDAKCLLIADPITEEAQARIDAVLSTNDGFEVAQKDLMIRGPGEFFGRHQHGLNELKIANPQTQLDILQQAREEAIQMTKSDPRLEKESSAMIRRAIVKRYPAYLANILSG